jgi:type IV secretory pathway VirB10-like protein
LHEGDPAGALVLLRAAEKAAPDIARIRARRREVADQAQALDRLETRSTQVSKGLETARIAAEGGHWDEAREAAQAVLELEPDNQQAERIVDQADSAEEKLERQRREEAQRRARAAAKAAAPEPEVAAPAAQPAAEDAKPEAGTAEAEAEAGLDLHFYTALPEGVLTIYFGKEQLARESYRFFRREGLFKSVPTAGTVDNHYKVPAGPATLRILVALPGHPAISQVLEGNFPGGTTRRLEIRLDGKRHLSAHLE